MSNVSCSLRDQTTNREKNKKKMEVKNCSSVFKNNCLQTHESYQLSAKIKISARVSLQKTNKICLHPGNFLRLKRQSKMTV